MKIDIQGMFEQLAELGTAPRDGCSLFGAGNDAAFAQLKQHYLIDRFGRGRSAEKFIVGPFGSGKTHFLRQLMEMGRDLDCVTIEVQLNKNVDFAKGIVIYQEIARECRAPGSDRRGIGALIVEATERIRRKADGAGMPSADVLRRWADGLASRDFKSLAFGRVLARAVHAHIDGDNEMFEFASRWLSGDVASVQVAKSVGESTMTQAELNSHALNARLSLFQFIKHAGYHGTILGFDEAEQGLAVDKKRMAAIFSRLLSEINALTDLTDGSALVLHAVTGEVVEQIQNATPMLAQRLADPAKNQGFFDGNPFAPQINLRQREDPAKDLSAIGQRLLEAYLSHVSSLASEQVDAVRRQILEFAREVVAEDQSSSARRLMVKRTCTFLLQIHAPHWNARPRTPEAEV